MSQDTPNPHATRLSDGTMDKLADKIVAQLQSTCPFVPWRICNTRYGWLKKAIVGAFVFWALNAFALIVLVLKVFADKG